MKFLPYYYYAPVFFKKTKIIFDFIDPQYLDDIKINAAFVKYINEIKKEPHFNDFEIFYDDFEKSYSKNEECSLEDIGLKAIQLEETILKATDYNQFYLSSPWVLTDRYFYPFGFRHIGSSRHALLYSCQLKGIGRNNLTHRGDFFHSWGGYPFSKNINALVNNIYIDETTPLGSLPIWGAARFTEFSIGSEMQSPALQIRDSNAYRLAHFDPGTSLTDKRVNNLIIDHLKDKWNVSSVSDVKQRALGQYLSYFQRGISPNSSLIPENMLFDARAIDTDEYEIFVSSKPVFTLSFLIQDKNLISLIKDKSLKECYRILKESGCLMRCENIFRIKSSWTMYAGIIDQLYDEKIDFKKNNDLLLNSLQAHGDKEMTKILTAFIKDVPVTISPNSSFKKVTPEIQSYFDNLNLVYGQLAGYEKEGSIYKITFSQDSSAYPLRHYAEKMTNLFLSESLPMNSTQDAIANFERLKNGLVQFIQQKAI